MLKLIHTKLRQWSTPKTICQLRNFLSLTSYYRHCSTPNRFVENRFPRMRSVGRKVNKAMVIAPALTLPDFFKSLLFKYMLWIMVLVLSWSKMAIQFLSLARNWVKRWVTHLLKRTPCYYTWQVTSPLSSWHSSYHYKAILRIHQTLLLVILIFQWLFDEKSKMVSLFWFLWVAFPQLRLILFHLVHFILHEFYYG